RRLTRAVEPRASGDVVHAAVDGDEYPAVRALAIVLGQLLDREVTALLHFLHRLIGLGAALDDLIDQNSDHAHEGEVHWALDDLADKVRQELRLLLLLLFRGRGLGHLDQQQRNKDMMDLLRYILPEHHDFFKSLPHTQNVDEQ
ncbi:hypothetical protein ALC60_04212, partial [Trachymyrmex zeteki]